MRRVIDLAELLRPHEGKWVILSEGELKILCWGTSMHEALAKSEGNDNAIIIKVPDKDSPYLL